MATAYEPTTFVPGGFPPISSSELNKLAQAPQKLSPVGEVIAGFGVFPGFLELNGAEVSRSQFDALFEYADSNSLIGPGKPFGAGDGATTFVLPNTGGRVPIGRNLSIEPGETGGSSEHSHTNPQTGSGGSHSHSNPNTSSGGSHSHSNPSTGSAGSHSHTVPDTSSAGSHSHSQGSTGSAGSHSHSFSDSFVTSTSPNTTEVRGTSGVFGMPQPSHTHSGSVSGSTNSTGSHSHSNPNTASGGSHSHTINNTGSNGSHTHTIANTGSGGSHSHSQGNTGSAASHQHSVGATDSKDHLPPFIGVIWQIRY